MIKIAYEINVWFETSLKLNGLFGLRGEGEESSRVAHNRYQGLGILYMEILEKFWRMFATLKFLSFLNDKDKKKKLGQKKMPFWSFAFMPCVRM